MTTRTLQSMFNPRSIAIIGRGHPDQEIDATLQRNLINAGFKGPVLPVNPDRPAVAGVFTYPNIAGLPVVPDLAILITPLEECLGLIRELGARGSDAGPCQTGAPQPPADSGQQSQHGTAGQ